MSESRDGSGSVSGRRGDRSQSTDRGKSSSKDSDRSKQSGAGQSRAGQPRTGQSSTSRSSTSQPRTGQSSTSRSSTSQPRTGQSSTSRSSTSQPRTGQSSTSRSSTSQPGSSQSRTGEPRGSGSTAGVRADRPARPRSTAGQWRRDELPVTERSQVQRAYDGPPIPDSISGNELDRFVQNQLKSAAGKARPTGRPSPGSRRRRTYRLRPWRLLTSTLRRRGPGLRALPSSGRLAARPLMRPATWQGCARRVQGRPPTERR